MDIYNRIKKIYNAWPLIILLTIFIILPYHALVTTWAGVSFGHPDLFKIWKELLLTLLSTYCFWLIYRSRRIRQALAEVRGILFAASAYSLYTILYGIWAMQSQRVSTSALLYAIIINLRLAVIFFVSFIVSTRFVLLKKKWAWIIIGPAILVIFFGILQAIVLPKNILIHFGYSKETILPFQLVDNKPDFVRIQSTLRGANPLGAYLVLVMTSALVLLRGASRRSKSYIGLITVSGLFVLFHSYSRSAWIGLVLSVGYVLLAFMKSRHISRNHYIRLSILLLIIIILLGLIGARSYKGRFVQNALFHTDSSSRSSNSSNEERSRRIRTSSIEVLREPFGRGPGTAGPASTRNTKAPPRISENYYLQIGQEVGWIGLGLFLWLNFMVCKALWGRRSEVMCVALLASFIGIVAINMLSHAWADDVLGLLWWGMAGIALSPAIIKQKRHHNAKTQEKTT